MSGLEWIILGGILLLGVVVCIVMSRLKKKHGYLPGSMCSGCPHTATVDRTKSTTDNT